MTGALQNHARRYQIPIDTLNFGFRVKQFEGPDAVYATVPSPSHSRSSEAPDDGIFIDGLYIEAGRWDRGMRKLAVAMPGEMFSV